MEPMPEWEEGDCAKTAAQAKEERTANRRIFCTKELSNVLGRSMANWFEGGKKAVKERDFPPVENPGEFFHRVENCFPHDGKRGSFGKWERFWVGKPGEKA